MSPRYQLMSEFLRDITRPNPRFAQDTDAPLL
jgi:hypothetical protein